MAGQYMIVKLLEPGLCMTCRFARLADVQEKDGATRRMLHCTRQLCDDHEYVTNPDPLNVVEIEERK